MSGDAQLSLGCLPVSAPELELERAYEQRLLYVLNCARAYEHDARADVGPWWTGESLANRMGEPVQKLGPDLHRLRERGALDREHLGTDSQGRSIWVWAVARGSGGAR